MLTTQRGFTLVELLVALTLAMSVCLIAMRFVLHHVRASAALGAQAELRASLRDAEMILSTDVRSISTAGDSLLAATDTAFEAYTALGGGIVCAVPTPTQIVLSPDSSTLGDVTGGMRSDPDSGDVVALFDATDGTWRHAPIGSVRTVSAISCSGAVLTPAELDPVASTVALTLAGAVTPTVRMPAVVLRRARYDVYRASDGSWYLGYRRCDASGCAIVQPVAGPFDRPVAPTFTYRDRAGAKLTGPAARTGTARIDVSLHASSSRPLSIIGAGAPLRDSAAFSIAVRNAP